MDMKKAHLREMLLLSDGFELVSGFFSFFFISEFLIGRVFLCAMNFHREKRPTNEDKRKGDGSWN